VDLVKCMDISKRKMISQIEIMIITIKGCREETNFNRTEINRIKLKLMWRA